LVVTDLGERLRWIKRTIAEVEKPTGVRSDQRFEIVKLNRLTPSEFLTNVKQLLGIPADKFETTDGNLLCRAMKSTTSCSAMARRRGLTR